ncbi:MAG: Bax inhibitor-1 family protein [Candidatus Ranarchaeia archaeon]|jgi:FtsH-binding integral membrane protein
MSNAVVNEFPQFRRTRLPGGGLMRDEVIRYKVFPMLTIMIILMTLGAFSVAQMLKGVFGVTSQSIAMNVFSNIVGVIAITLVYFVLFIVAFITSKVKYLNLITASIFALFTGGGIFGTVFLVSDAISAQIVPEALVLTAGLFTITVLYQFITKKDLSHWTWWMLFGLFVVIGVTVAIVFIQASWLRILIDLGVVVFFILLVRFDMYHIQEILPDEDWMLGVMQFFLDFGNLLIRIMWLLIQIAAESS